MRTNSRSLVIAGLLTSVAFGQSPNPLSQDAKNAWSAIRNNILKSAEKMPEEKYGFRPTPEVRTFGQLIGHVIDAHYLFCSPVADEMKPMPGAEKKLSAKADLVSALKESSAYCDSAYDSLSDSKAAEMVKLFGRDKPKLSILTMNIAHDNEHYGNIVTYLRINGLVPPSSEGRQMGSGPKPRLLYDLSHGQMFFAAQPGKESELRKAYTEMAASLGIELDVTDQSLTSGVLAKYRTLVIQTPLETVSPAEIEAIVEFVNRGGSLLLVLDEERRQSLAKTRVNEIATRFGLKLTDDTPYLHNRGAIAPAGSINAEAREIPYSGGRAVEGGTPFSYILDAEGKPTKVAHAAWAQTPSGGRVVVMGEAMAMLLFLGKPEGTRLSGDMKNTTYWGKDSSIFVKEVIGWLSKR